MTSAPPVQRRLPITVPIVGPLKSIEAARADLETDEDDIVHLIQDKQLLAFDLKMSGADRSFIRIWPPSLAEVRASRAFGIIHEPKFNLDEIVPKIISTNRAQVPLTILRRRLVVSAWHIHALLMAKLLQPVPGTGNTVNKAPQIIRSSIVEFLKARRINGLS